MQYPLCLVVALLAASACGGVDSDFSETTSLTIFTTSNGELHTLHTTALELDEWPTTYTWQCAGGGSIDMVTRYNGAEQLENIDELHHTLTNCAIDGRTYNGTMDYQKFSFVTCGGASGVAFDIAADLEITGPEEGRCVMDAREDCGEASGSTCGHEI